MTAGSRRYALVAAGAALVLVIAFLGLRAVSGESEESEYAREAFDAFVERWPTTVIDGTSVTDHDSLASTSNVDVCDDPDHCHVVWAHEERSADDITEVDGLAIVAVPAEAESLEFTDLVQIIFVDWSETEENSETVTDNRVSDPITVPVDIPTLSFRVDNDDTFLFPVGAENMTELRYSKQENEVVEEELDVPDDAEEDRVRQQNDWWPSNQAAGIDAIIRYQIDGETVYRIRGNHQACVEEFDVDCLMEFPSEGVLVSLRSVWETFQKFDPGPGHDHVLKIDDSVRIDGTFEGLFTENTTDAVGGLAEISWEKGMGGDREEERTAFAIYYENGYPATLSAAQSTEPQDSGVSQEEYDGRAAVFGDPAKTGTTEISLDPMVPVAFHPSGEPPLVAPRMDTETEHERFTIYEPIDPDDWSPVAFTHLGEDGNPVTTQWLVETGFHD